MTSHASLSTQTEHLGTLYFVALLREELGRRIATARTAAGLSQQQLAEKIGLKHAQDVSRYERGKIEVPGHRIDLIAEATGRTRSYFVRDPAEPEVSSTPQPSNAEMVAQLAELEGAVRSLERMVLEMMKRLPPQEDTGSASS